VGCIAYADDIVLLSPSLSSLSSMLRICEQFSEEFNISFNVKKSKLLVYGKATNNVCVKLQGNVIAQSTIEKHVGNVIGTGPDIDKIVIHNACNELYAKVNLLLRQIGKSNCFIIYRLFNNFCMSLYGCQLWNLASTTVLEPIYIAWRKCIRRIFKIPNMTHCNLVHLICQDICIKTRLHRRFIKFFIETCKSNNSCVALASKMALNGSMSQTGDSLNFISHLYDLNKYNMTSYDLLKIKSYDSVDNLAKAGAIIDFITYREAHPYDTDICSIIDDLCTD